MNKEQIDIKEFMVAKYLASWIHGEKIVAADYYLDRMERELVKAQRYDESVLLRFLRKQVEEGNSKITATRTRLDKLRYSPKWRNSDLFKGIKISFMEISSKVDDQPGADAYDIYQKIKSSTLL